ncbi:MAG: hypothetical protein JRJ02_04500 [Deltaproteobacteria bacterium]|nr:hypothetical protein [Deltaproteobacteria bacterium]
MKRIVFECGSTGYYKLMHRLGSELEKAAGIEPLFTYYFDNVKNYLLKQGVPLTRLRGILDGCIFGEWKNRKPCMDYLKKMEALYGIPNLWLIWETVRNHQYDYSYDDALMVMEDIFKRYINFVENEHVDAVISNAYPSTIPSLIFYRVLERNNIPMYIMAPHRIGGRFVIYKGYEDKYEKVDNIFEAIKGRPLNDEENHLAEKFISTFRGTRYVSTQDKIVEKKRDFSLEQFQKMVNGLYEAYRYKTYKKYRSNRPSDPLFYIKDRMGILINKRRLKRSKVFVQPDYEKKYILFYLHRQPEASTMTRAPFYLDQIQLIHNISKSLPVDYLLYIKPHYNDFGNQKIAYYRSLAQRPNIQVLSAYCDGHRLIRKCSLIITITGTVGWEGILHGKPVFTFGNVFYNSFPLVTRIHDIKELPYLIRKTLESFKPDPELLKKYIVAQFQGTYEGSPLVPGRAGNRALEPGRIKKIVAGIREELGL